MDVTVIRRGVRVDPADEADLLWIFEQFNQADTWRTFGYGGPAMAEAMTSYLERPLVLGVIRRWCHHHDWASSCCSHRVRASVAGSSVS